MLLSLPEQVVGGLCLGNVLSKCMKKCFFLG